MAGVERLQWAVYEAVHAYGVKDMAAVMRITPQALINKVAPGVEGQELTYLQFQIVVEITKSQAIIDALMEQAGMGSLEPAPSLLAAVLSASKESSDILSVFQEKSADGDWSLNDAKALEQEANEAVTAVGKVVSASWELARSGGRAIGGR